MEEAEKGNAGLGEDMAGEENVSSVEGPFFF